jgi:glutathione synthase/RimK-type ligase-like ATP-grasp enzyme
MRDVVLITGRDMPVLETETPLLLAALQAGGVDAAIETWRDEASTSGRLVVVRSPWDYVEHRDAFLAWARHATAVTELVNPVEVLEWSSHKRYLLDLVAAGVAVIPTVLVPSGASASMRRGALGEFGGDVVVKPAVSGGARGTKRLPAASADASDHLALLVEAGDALVQPFEPAVLAGEVSLLFFGDVFSHAVRKVPGVDDYRVQAEYGGTVAPHVATDAELAVAAAALAIAPGEVAYGRVDLVTTDAGPVTMELELVEPELFLRTNDQASARYADYLIARLNRT